MLNIVNFTDFEGNPQNAAAWSQINRTKAPRVSMWSLGPME